MTNSNFLKKLLTTASVIAVSASAGNAFATLKQIDANATIINAALGVGIVDTAAPPVAAKFNNADSLAYLGNYTLTTGGDVIIGALDINNKAAGLFTAAHNVSLSAVTNSTGAQKLAITVNNGKTLTLDNKDGLNANGQAVTGGVFTSLGPITLGSGGGGGSTLAINTDTTLSNAILDNTVNSSTINIAGNVNLNGALGAGQAIGTLDIKADKSATLGAASNVKLIKIGNNASLNVASGINITSENIKGAPAKQGDLKFAGTSTATVTKIGNAGALNAVELNGTGTVNFATTTDFTATTTTLNHASAIIQFSTDATIKTNFVTTGGSKIITKGDTTITGSIGAADETFSEVQVAGNKTLTLDADDAKLYADDITAAANAAKIAFKGDNLEIHSNIGTTGAKFAEVSISSAAATTVKLMDKNITATKVDLATAAVDNTLELHEGSSITSNITTSNANLGILSIKGNTKIDGLIGAVGSVINQLKFDSTGTLELTKSTITTANGINFASDGTLKLTEDADINFNEIAVANSDIGTGSIIIETTTADRVHTFNKAIGDTTVANKALKLLEVKANSTIQFDKSAAIKKIETGTTDSKITLNKVGGEFLIGDFSHSDAKGRIALNEDSTLKEGTKLSSSLNRLESISFDADKTLTVENGINLYTDNGVTGGIRSYAYGKGKLAFKGDSIVGAHIGLNIELGEISVTGDKKTVDFLNKVNIVRSLKISQGATAILRDQFTGGDIQGAAAGEGTIKFSNSEAFTAATLKPIKTDIGFGNTLDTVEIAGSDITFASDEFNTNNLSFTSPGNTTITFENVGATGKLNNTTITSNSTSRGHNIVLAALAAPGVHQAFTKNIGTKNNYFGDILLKGDDTITTTADFYAGLVNSKDSEGTITFIKNGGVALNLGQEGSQLKKVEAKGSTTFLEDVWSKGVIIEANQTATFKKSVSGAANLNIATSEGLQLKNNSIANFEGANIDIAIGGKVGGTGRANFIGTTNLNAEIGAGAKHLDIVHLTKGSITNINADITANNINVDGSIKVAENINLSGVTTFANNSTTDLGSNNITLTDGASRFTGDNRINVTLNNNKELGSIVVDATAAAASLDATNATLITYITDTAPLPTADENYTLIRTNNNLLLTGFAGNNTVIKANGSEFVEWSTADGITATRKNVAASAVTGIIGSADNELLQDALQFVNVKNTGDAAAYAAELGRMSDDRLKDSVKRSSEQNSVHTNEMATSLMDSQTATINNRMGAFSNHPQPGVQIASTGNVSGVSAGEGDHTIYGAWVSPFYSQTTQKARGSRAGYKADSYGVTVGFDTQANADLTLGLAGTYAKTNAKHKNFKSGDKTEADTFMFSVYGIQQLTNNWFLQGHAAYATNKVKSSEKLITATTSQTAKADYDVTSYNTELLAGMNYNAAEVVVTPLVGVSYTRVNNSGYTETGTTIQNRTVRTKATNKFEAIAGMRAQMTTEVEGINVTPEIHGFVRHDLIAKDASTISSISGMDGSITPKSAKALKTTYNVGLGVNAVSGMYEYGAGYDLFAGNKTIGHQGTLKVRVNF